MEKPKNIWVYSTVVMLIFNLIEYRISMEISLGMSVRDYLN